MKQATGVLFLLFGATLWHIAASASAPQNMMQIWEDFLSVIGSGSPSSSVGTEIGGESASGSGGDSPATGIPGSEDPSEPPGSGDWALGGAVSNPRSSGSA